MVLLHKRYYAYAGLVGLVFLAYAGIKYREELEYRNSGNFHPLTMELTNESSASYENVVNFIQSSPGRKRTARNWHRHGFFTDPRALTIWCNIGRLGNQMGTYSTLYGIAILNNRNPYFQTCNTKHLRRYFQITGPEVRSVPDKFKVRHPIGSFLRKGDDKIPPEVNILEGDYLYPNSFTFFQHVQEEIRQEFRFHDSITQYAQKILHQLRGAHESVTFVGIHVRRGDYGHWLNTYEGREVDYEYFVKATEYFKKKFPDAMFIVVSDNRKWCRQFFSNLSVIVAPPAPDPGHDMALLVNCNHTIMTYGTFGFWAAYLTGGETVYFDDYLKPGSNFLVKVLPYNITFLPNWVGLNTTKPGFWENYRKEKVH